MTTEGYELNLAENTARTSEAMSNTLNTLLDESIVDNEAIDTIPSVETHQPISTVTKFLGPGFVPVIYRKVTIRTALNQNSDQEITCIAKVKVASSEGSTLTICRTKQLAAYFLGQKWDVLGMPELKSERLRQLADEQNTNFVAVVKIDPEDALLCQEGPVSGFDIIQFLKPVLVYYNTGLVELQYGLFVALDKKARKLVPHAHKYISRVLEDPHITDPGSKQVSCANFLELITSKRSDSGLDLPIHPRPNGLRPQLLPYQQESVVFCLRREGKELISPRKVRDLDMKTKTTVINPPLGWHKIPNTEYWLNPYSMRTSSRTPVRYSDTVFKGYGILAEEMGLGKTVEMISLILLNPFNAEMSGNDVEVESAVEGNLDAMNPNKLIDIKATIVVSPKTINAQWNEEVRKHAPHLKVVQLFGPHDIRLDDFVDADVIVIAYELLASQLEQAQFVPMKRRTRFNLSKDVAINFRCDLMKVRFWRVILDEIQMVHTSVSAAAKVVKLLPTVHAWCVSGTPVSGNLDDLHNIFHFLHLEPFVEEYAWRGLISSESDFRQVIKPICCRHTKASVADQFHIPKQNRKLILMRFSKVEKYQYDRIFEDFRYGKQTNLYNAFQALGRACCSAFVHRAIDSTMEDTVKTLIKEQKSQLLSDRRERILSMQSLAQNLDHADRIEEAITCWEQLQVEIEDYGKYIDDDFEQHQKALSQKNEIFTGNHDPVHSSSRLSEFKDLLHRTYFFLGTSYYRASKRMRLKLSEKELETPEVKKQIATNKDREDKYYKLAEDLRESILKKEIDIVNEAVSRLSDSELNLVRVTSEKNPKWGEGVTNDNKALFSINRKLTNILKLPLIGNADDENDDNDAYADTLNAQDQAHDLLNEMKRHIYNRSLKINEYVDEEDTITVLKKESRTLLKRYARLRDVYNKRVEYYKKLQGLSDKVADVNVETLYDGDALVSSEAKVEKLNTMVDNARRNVDRLTGVVENSAGRVRYLSSLLTDSKRVVETKGIATPVCTICLEEYILGSVGPCGHAFCTHCLEDWVTSHHSCPLCKQFLNLQEIRRFDNSLNRETQQKVEDDQYIGYVRIPETTKPEENSTELYNPVSEEIAEGIHSMHMKETYGAKVDTIVRHALWIRSRDPSAQIVIFSQWDQLLETLSSVMDANGLLVLGVGRNFNYDIYRFKSDTSAACLLLHTRNKVAGLTLVNATHVFLCEPLLNTAIELQAISRVARIGQTRETTVWQFCIENTIEQKILGYTTKRRLRNMSKSGADAAHSKELENALQQRTALDSKGVEIVDDSILRQILLNACANTDAVDIKNEPLK